MFGGKDEKGSEYPSISEMWEYELNNKKPSGKGKVVEPVGSVDNWYNKANQYWSKQQASYNGVLGGYGNLSALDIKFSLKFMMQFFKENPKFERGRVIDCGAGVGRISKELLCQVFKKVDLIDQCQKYIDKAKQILKDKNAEKFYAKGLQQFQFEQKYDCIWIQWVFSQLTDEDGIAFLKKCKDSLTENGIIILKQNHSGAGFLVDKADFSVSRSYQLFKNLFDKAELKIVKDQIQKDWPKQLLGVRMYLLQ